LTDEEEEEAAAADEDQARKAGRSRTGTSRESALTRKLRSSVSRTTSRRNRLTPSVCVQQQPKNAKRRKKKKNGHEINGAKLSEIQSPNQKGNGTLLPSSQSRKNRLDTPKKENLFVYLSKCLPLRWMRPVCP
jgi:hypothetical protein